MTIDFQIRFPVVDTELSRLHHDAFGGRYECAPWRSRLERHSKSWVGAFSDGQLCGFVHAVWDGEHMRFFSIPPSRHGFSIKESGPHSYLA